MTISAKVAGTELQTSMNNRYAGVYLEAILLNAPGVAYNPANDDTQNAAFLTNEIAEAGGYQRQVIGWDVDTAGAYTDDGVAMSQRAVTYEHDGSATNISFTHMALIWGSGNIDAGGTAATAPAGSDNGTYVGLPTDTDGSGNGATLDIVVTNGGAAASDYAITVNAPGYGYAASDTLTVQNADLVSAGLNPGDSSPLTFTISSVYTSPDAGKVLSVAQTDSQVTITDGNSAAFYINLKQFGFYSV